MNQHMREVNKDPDREDAENALAVLQRYLNDASSEARADLGNDLRALLPISNNYPTLNRNYNDAFEVDETYRAGLPDLQNGPASLIKGDRREIQHVGISNFRLPLRFSARGGSSIMLETSVTGTVSLAAQNKGINMSRIMRSFYEYAEKQFDFDLIDAVLDDYQRDLDSVNGRIFLKTSYPMRVESLRSGLSGYQYYDIGLDTFENQGQRTRILHLDYVYSSTCPCSLELAEHARQSRGQLATPHSQRSRARLSMVLNRDAGPLWVEDIVEACRKVVPTETQVMVKREDEQAFAELNAANPIFVEDAARLFAQALSEDERITDFRVLASHQESLHSHDAISALTSGETFAQNALSPNTFSALTDRM